MKTTEREEAIRLRRQHGLPVREIASRLGVSCSTASRWLKNVTLTPE
ncbi:MAG: helix-turn-helix domain-containing protein, partial [Gaiellaceae bacterium]